MFLVIVMKIVFLSDFHLGFSQKGRENEAFTQAKNALNSALKEKPDLIVFTGDMFHKSIPEQETLLQAFELLSRPHLSKGEHLVIEKESNGKKTKLEPRGIPFIAIHGTHEFRGKDFVNIMQILESAGFLVHLHGERAIVRKHREKIALHGLGGVPEKKARDVLNKWNPKPVKEAFNIVLLHQSFKEFLPFDDEMVATLSLSDLPEGFDLFVNGHLHWNNEFQEHGKHLIIPGSTVITQMKKLEAKKEKGYFLLDTKTQELKFKTFPGQRAFHYKKIEFSKANAEEIERKTSNQIKKLLSKSAKNQKPLIKLKLTGTLAKGFNSSDLDLVSVVKEFEERAIVSISSSFQEESFKKKIKELGDLQAEKKSVSELGLDLLEKNLEETDFGSAFDSRRVFKLLKNDKKEKAMKLISSLKKPSEKNKK